MRDVPLPEKAAANALHIATAAVHGMQYLLTWNCTHITTIGGATTELRRCAAQAGFEPPLICTPEELSTEGLNHG